MRRRILFGAAIFGGLAILSVGAQLLYPTDRLLPLMRINGENVGGRTVWQAIGQLEAQYSSASVQVEAGGALALAPFEEVGIDVSATPTVLAASKYSVAQRLIPFSSIFVMLERDVTVNLRVDTQRVQYFAEQFEQQSAIPAVNAGLQVESDRVKLLPAKPNQVFTAKNTYDAIMKAPVSPRIRVAPVATVKPAPVSDQAAQAVLKRAEKMLATPLSLRVGDADVTADKTTIASWLDFPVADGKMDIAFKPELVKQYVEKVQPSAYQAPGATRITTLDGHETGRAVGIAGKGIDINGAAALIQAHLLAGASDRLVLPTVALAPGTTYVRQYSDTSTGLAALLKDVTEGKNYGVAVAELGGKGRSASVNGDKVYIAASTYKLYVAYAVFQLIGSGEMHWSDTVSGLSADTCFEKMIVNSDNPCAEAFGSRIGWTRVQNMMRALGFSSVTMGSGGNYTTANDLVQYLRKLEDGSLLAAGNRDLLLGYMKRQIYRKGVPAAVGGVPVADKVGFIGSVIHDPAIVYAPTGTYVMVIMTSGSNWTALSGLASQIHTYITR